jgi:multiple sugar transport system permease protein
MLAARLRRIGGYALLLGVSAIFLFPLWWVVTSAFRPGTDIVTDPLTFDPRSFTLDNFREMFRSVPLATGFFNTFLVVAIKGTITMVFCPLAGYAFAKFRFPGRSFLFGFVLATLMLPVIVLIIPLLLEMSALGWVNSYQALILPGAIDAFSIFWMRQVIADIPDEVLDAARIDGATPLGVFRRIVVPIIRPGLAALGVLTFFNIYNDFVWPVVAINTEDKQTLQVLMYNLAALVSGAQVDSNPQNVWGQVLAACTVAMAPMIVGFVLLQSHFINGILAGSLK